MSNVPVLQAVRSAEAFRRLHWRRVAGVLAVAAVCGTLSQAGALAHDNVLRVLGDAGYIISAIMGYAALMRLAFIDEHPDDPELVPGTHGFQWSKPEWRLVGIGLLMMFLVVLAAAMFGFLSLVVLVSAGLAGAVSTGTSPETIMAALSPNASLTLRLLFLVFALGLLVTSVRLSLAPAATIARREVLLFQTWPLTKGQFWRIFAATILVGLPSIAAGIVMALLLAIVGFNPQDPAAQLALPVAILVGAVPGLVGGFVTLPLSAGLTAFLYRGLRPPEEAPTQLG